MRICLAMLVLGGSVAAQIPNAPPVPVCGWDSASGQMRSTCKFKDAVSGTPTSVVGNRVFLFDLSTGGHVQSRLDLRASLTRLSTRYGFNLLMTQLPTDITVANLTTAKVFIMSNGQGDRIPAGAIRTTMENFQLQSGWGVIWIHDACSFITTGWPFGQQSCVQLYYHADGFGTPRRMFIDSGTAASPNHGRRNPQSEFLLHSLPGWGTAQSLAMTDEWFCFRAPARNTPGVNVLFGYDRSSGLPYVNCTLRNDSTEFGSQYHNMVWTHMMGNGITIYNSWGHDVSMYTGNGNMGDSLLWRFLRYSAKDWCVTGSGEPGCDVATPVFDAKTIGFEAGVSGRGGIFLTFPESGRFSVSVTDVRGKRVFASPFSGPGKMEIPGLRLGLHIVRVSSHGQTEARKVMVYSER